MPNKITGPNAGEPIQSFAGGEVRVWIEQECSIHLKAVSSHGDPTELTAEEAREIATALIVAAD